MTTHQDPVIAPLFIGQVQGGASVQFGADGAISPDIGSALITKAGVFTGTVAAPGAANVGKTLRITAGTTAAHVVTVTGLLGGTTLTFSTIGESVTLYAISATQWALQSNNGVVQSA